MRINPCSAGEGGADRTGVDMEAGLRDKIRPLDRRWIMDSLPVHYKNLETNLTEMDSHDQNAFFKPWYCLKKASIVGGSASVEEAHLGNS